jgi:hypothetical protein
VTRDISQEGHDEAWGERRFGTVEFGGEYHSHLLGDALFTQKV